MPDDFPGGPGARSLTFTPDTSRARLLRLLFIGSGPFGATVLENLHAGSHTVCAVLSRPDRPTGRGLRVRPTPVSEVAKATQTPLLRPDSLEVAAREELAAYRADALVVVDFGRLIPGSWLRLCPGGALNVHASLLPRWRGAAPIARAIEAGDARAGCTIMLMDAGLDTGDILVQESVPFSADETTDSARTRLAASGSTLLLRYLSDFDPGHPARQPQDEARACHAAALRKSEALLNWQQPATRLAAKIRAFNPHPVAVARYGEGILRLWQARAHPGEAAEPPGTVLHCNRQGLWVACGEGRVQITELQRPGGRRMPARDFCNARPLTGLRLA